MIKNIKDYGIRKWQSKIGYVPQQPKIFDSTIKANIAFGIDDSLIDENKVIECLKLVGLKEKYITFLMVFLLSWGKWKIILRRSETINSYCEIII